MAVGEQEPPQSLAESLRAGGVRAAFDAGITDLKVRVRQGELGVLPVILSLAAIWIFFEIQDQHFLTARNLSNLVLQIAVTGTIAIGIVFVLLLGEIDLSVGSVAGLCSAVLGVTVVAHGVPWWAGIAIMLLSGILIGAFHSVWFALIGVPAFVVTLAGNLGWLGVQLHVLGQTGTINVFEKHISAIATTYLPDAWGWLLAVVVSVWYAVPHLIRDSRRRRAGLAARPPAVVIAQALGLVVIALGVVAVLNSYKGVPTAGLILLGLVVTFSWVATRTRFGRYVYAVGGSAEAARRAGINVKAIRMTVFTMAGFFAAVGGLLAVSRNAAAGTQTGGGTLLLEVIAAAVIGGTSLFGGRGTVWSALFGAMVIGSVSNGLDLIGQPADVKYIVEGAILLAAITVDTISRRGREAAGR
jgi:D-xylose transport system permease protein